ncbi:MAG: flagellar hook-length control protein FliK [Aliidongia sp.]|nr:flagellar hook-length control protein FliK [Aliidongia sp.]
MTVSAIEASAPPPAASPANATAPSGQGGFADLLQLSVQRGVPASGTASSAVPARSMPRAALPHEAKDSAPSSDGEPDKIAVVGQIPVPVPVPVPVAIFPVPIPAVLVGNAAGNQDPKILSPNDNAPVPAVAAPALSLSGSTAVAGTGTDATAGAGAVASFAPIGIPTVAAPIPGASSAASGPAVVNALPVRSASLPQVATASVTAPLPASPSVASEPSQDAVKVSPPMETVPAAPAALVAASAPAPVPAPPIPNTVPLPVHDTSPALASTPRPSPTSAAGAAGRAGGSASSGSGTVRVLAAAPPVAGVGVTEPSLLVALQAQEQVRPSSDTAPKPDSTVDAQIKDDQNTAAAADPTASDFAATLAAQNFPAPNATAQIAGARPPVIDPAGDHKSPAVAAVPAGAAAPDTAASAAPLATGFAATAAGPLGQASPTTPATPAGPTTPATLPAVQLALAITHNAASGAQSFTLQLKPERLGTVDVKLDLDAKGHATASFIADRPETLALLRQDAHHLVKSLNDAGVNTDAGSLNFSLRNSGEGFGQAQERRNGNGQASRRAGLGGAPDVAELPSPAIQSSGANRLYDIRA